MTRKMLGALVVGLLVGVLIGGLLPVQAGARHPAKTPSTLAQRVARLEAKTKHLNLQGELRPDFVVTQRCSSGQPAIWQSVNGNLFKLGC
ncbi:MAG: hypothetical protein ACXVPL_05820 [Actinomycetota bacterium]